MYLGKEVRILLKGQAKDSYLKLKLAKRGRERNDYLINYRKKIGDETDSNKHRVFAELLFGDGVQKTISESTNEQQ